jgi:hypothetical protein
MANPDLTAYVRNLPLFADLPLMQLQQVSTAFQILRVQANQYVFRQGQPAQGLYLLVQGQGALVQETLTSGERLLGEVRVNQYVGESALFQAGNERMSLRAVQPSILLFLARDAFHAILLEHPEIRPYLKSEFVHFGPDSPPDFHGQRSTEQMLLRQHRHPWAFVRGLWVVPFILLVLWGSGLLLVSGVLTIILLMLGVVVSGAYIYYRYVEWQNDFIIVTNQRVIHTERTILSFENQTREVPISTVQEVSIDLPAADIFARIFQYGTVIVKTAGEAGNMVLTVMANPQNIQKVVLIDQQGQQRQAEREDREAIGSVIDSFLNPNAPQNPEEEAEAKKDQLARPGSAPSLLSTRYVNEQGAIVYRKHITVWLSHVSIPIMILMIGVGLTFVGLVSATTNPLNAFELLIGGFLMLVALVWFYWVDWDWRNDMMVLGDTTVSIVHRRPLWLQDFSEQALLTEVTNVDTRRDGILNTLLNRGDVNISLIGDDRPKDFKSVSNPDQVRDEVFQRRSALLQRKEDEELMRQRQEIARYLDVYHERVSSQHWPVQPDRGTRPPRVPRSRNT